LTTDNWSTANFKISFWYYY